LLSAGGVFTGLLLICPEYDVENRFFQGLLVGVISALTFALLTVLNKRFVSTKDPIRISFFQNFWAAIFMLPCSKPLLSLTSFEWLLVLFLGVFCTALAHSLFIYSLRRIRPQLASTAAGLEPVYGIFLAIMFLGEYPSLREVVGGLLILCTVVAASKRVIA
jgi:drug/metabolite transporter (DMT)-like permease